MPSNASLFVSILALVFTILSFWWMNWRPGSLSVGNLQGFIAGRGTILSASEPNEPNFWVMGLPLILLNRGASPLVVESLRLVPSHGTPGELLLFERTETPAWTENPQKEKIERDPMFLPRAIKANDVTSANFVFNAQKSTRKYEARLYHYALEAKLTGHRDWQKVKDLEFDFRELDDQKLYELNAFYKPYRYRKGERA